MIVAGSYLLPRHSLSLLTAAFGAVFSLAFAPSFAVGQMVTANDDVVEDSNVPKWLRDRPLGLTIGYTTAYEGAGELSLSISLASDYSSAKAARSPLQTMSSIDIPIVNLDLLQLGVSGNLWLDISGTGARNGLDLLYPSVTAGIWGSIGIESIALDAKILGKVWAPEEFPNPREGYEAQVGLTLYSPMMRLGGGRSVDLAVRADLTMADDLYMDQHFGISETEALTSGLDAFNASAGLKSAGLSIGTAVPLTRNFELQGSAGMVQLLDSAAASPWVLERGELTDVWGNLGFAFRF
jgi:hypothetical protein